MAELENQTITEKTKILFHFSSGKVEQFKPYLPAEKFAEKVTQHMQLGDALLFKNEETKVLSFVNMNCVEKVEVVGEAVYFSVQNKYSKRNNKNEKTKK